MELDMMSNDRINDIDKLSKKITMMWKEYPSLRFFQFIEVLKSKIPYTSDDYFAFEDSKLDKYFNDRRDRKFIKELKLRKKLKCEARVYYNNMTDKEKREFSENHCRICSSQFCDGLEYDFIHCGRFNKYVIDKND